MEHYESEKNALDYPHSNFCRVACCIASGYRSNREYRYYGGGCEYAAGCFRYDLRYAVGALCRRHFAHYGEADWNRSALELDTFYCGRKHYPRIDLALHRGNRHWGQKYTSLIIALAAAAAAKFLALYIGTVQIAVPLLLKLPELQAAVISSMFSIPQLATALLGGGMALLVLTPLKRAIEGGQE